MLVYGEDAYVAVWVASKLEHVDEFDQCTAIGITSGEELIAGCVYTRHQKKFRTVEMSIASTSPMWAKKENIAGLLKYPFEQLDVFKAYAVIMQSNEKALKTIAHIGFRREAILAHQFGKKQHAVVLRMLRPDYDRLYGEPVR